MARFPCVVFIWLACAVAVQGGWGWWWNRNTLPSSCQVTIATGTSQTYTPSSGRCYGRTQIQYNAPTGKTINFACPTFNAPRCIILQDGTAEPENRCGTTFTAKTTTSTNLRLYNNPPSNYCRFRWYLGCTANTFSCIASVLSDNCKKTINVGAGATVAFASSTECQGTGTELTIKSTDPEKVTLSCNAYSATAPNCPTITVGAASNTVCGTTFTTLASGSNTVSWTEPAGNTNTYTCEAKSAP